MLNQLLRGMAILPWISIVLCGVALAFLFMSVGWHLRSQDQAAPRIIHEQHPISFLQTHTPNNAVLSWYDEMYPVSTVAWPPKRRLGWQRKKFVAEPCCELLQQEPLIDTTPILSAWQHELTQWHRQDGGGGDRFHRAPDVIYHLLKRHVLKLRPLIVPLYSTDQAIVMWEGRASPQVAFVLKHTLHMLGPGWGVVLFITAKLLDYYSKQLELHPGGWGQHISVQLVADIAYDQANSLPTSFDTLQRIDCETFIILQTDAFMVRSPYLSSPMYSWNDTAEARKEFNHMLGNYICLGAPWDGFPHLQACGNGGLTMRKRSAMEMILSPLNCVTGSDCRRINFYHTSGRGANEDAWLAGQMGQMSAFFGKHLAYRELSARFASESSHEHRHPWPFFVHAFWRYQSVEYVASVWAKLLGYYLQPDTSKPLITEEIWKPCEEEQ